MTRALDVIQPHDTWNVIDPSKLGVYMSCPRKYFFEYIFGWRPSYPNNDLLFGTSWHLALDALASGDMSPDALEEAKLIFLARYRQEMPETMDKENYPKEPMRAFMALESYTRQFRSDIRRYERLHTEIGGVVLISPTSELYFKMDWVGRERDTGKVLFIDYKTSKYHDSSWGHRWTFSTQMLTYYHVLHCLYPRERLGESVIRCSFFHRDTRRGEPREPTHEEQLLIKTPAQMNAFLVRTNIWYQQLQYDMQLLEEADIDDNIMLAFAQNDQACYQYNRECPYKSLCDHWHNPLQHYHSLPGRLKQQFWDPRKMEGMRETVSLAPIGANEADRRGA